MLSESKTTYCPYNPHSGWKVGKCLQSCAIWKIFLLFQVLLSKLGALQCVSRLRRQSNAAWMYTPPFPAGEQPRRFQEGSSLCHGDPSPGVPAPFSASILALSSFHPGSIPVPSWLQPHSIPAPSRLHPRSPGGAPSPAQCRAGLLRQEQEERL